jgi:bifunctional NMN adenylyltransferase/nudix hydrolase
MGRHEIINKASLFKRENDLLSVNTGNKDSLNLRPKENVNPADYEVGCMIMRLQVHELHEAHRALIDLVVKNHTKVILFLGVAIVQNTKRNPLDFATRCLMVREHYPDIVILPLNDMRNDEDWSAQLDQAINMPFGNDKKVLLYGGRDSFIPYYNGRHTTTELTTDRFVSGTEIRNKVSKEILGTSDFRAGVIHSTFAQRPCPYPTVDIAMIKDDGKVLLAKKPNEKSWRFPGGFFDVNEDKSFEDAALRELREECGETIECTGMSYVTSSIIDDWRYRKEDSKIVTSLYLTKYNGGKIAPNDDVSELMWVDLLDTNNKVTIMPEHQGLYAVLCEQLNHIFS